MNSVLEDFGRALDRLGEALEAPETELHRDASIQRFEFSFELGWKSVQVLMHRRGKDCSSPMGCLKAAWREGWLEEEQRWIDMLDDRNLATHTYKRMFAIDLYKRLPAHLAELRALFNRLAAVERGDE